jgi:hypothetical protein
VGNHPSHMEYGGAEYRHLHSSEFTEAQCSLEVYIVSPSNLLKLEVRLNYIRSRLVITVNIKMYITTCGLIQEL